MRNVDVLVSEPGWMDLLENPEAFCAHAIAACEGHVEARDGEISVNLSHDQLLAELNATYRDKDGPTNVLSFPQDRAQSFKDPILGDIVISLQTVLREAGQRRIDPRHHAAHMLVHGFLHLNGFDHIHRTDRAVMERHEREILAGLNIADPYVLAS